MEAYPELINTLDRLGAAPAKSEAIFHEAILLAQSAGDVRTEALLEAIYSQLTSSAQNDLAGLITHAKRAVMLADAQGDLPIRLLARHFLGRGHGVRGEWTDFIRILDQNIAIGGGDGAVKIEVLGWIPYLESLAIRSAVLCGMGDLREALEFTANYPALRALAATGADTSSAAIDRMWVCWLMGDGMRAKRYADEGLQLAERFGSDRNIVYALLACGNASLLGLRWKEGVGYLERAQELLIATGAGGEWSTMIDAHLAVCLAELGEHDRSLRTGSPSR